MTKTGYKFVKKSTYSSIFVQTPYSRTYIPGTIVEARPNTIGLMILSSIELANAFGSLFTYTFAKNLTLLEVEYDSNEVNIVDYICGYQDYESLQFFYTRSLKTNLEANILVTIPMGTVCCKKLKVIKVRSWRLL